MLANIQNPETHQFYLPLQSTHLCCANYARMPQLTLFTQYPGGYSLAFLKHGQTPASKDAKGIPMMRYQFKFIEVKSRAVSLAEGADDIQIPGITLGTTFPSSAHLSKAT